MKIQHTDLVSMERYNTSIDHVLTFLKRQLDKMNKQPSPSKDTSIAIRFLWFCRWNLTIPKKLCTLLLKLS